LCDGGKAVIQIARDVNVQKAAAALGKHAKIAARLRRLDRAESRCAAGNPTVSARRSGEKPHALLAPAAPN
jgi:hypothetical protein